MSLPKMSLKKLKILHQELGGNKNGYYITSYSRCITTGIQVSIDKRIAYFDRPTASANYYLVKGQPWKY